MPVSNIVIIILSLAVQLVDRNQRIVYVNESISDDEDGCASATGVGELIVQSDDEDLMYCVMLM